MDGGDTTSQDSFDLHEESLAILDDHYNQRIVFSEEFDEGCAVASAKFLLSFLKVIDQTKRYSRPSVVRRAIHRYENFWLPLLLKFSKDTTTDMDYLPPLDVHWVWVVHMLAPQLYRKDCLSIFGRIFGHVLDPEHVMEQKRENAKLIWDQEYPVESFYEEEKDEEKAHSQRLVNLEYETLSMYECQLTHYVLFSRLRSTRLTYNIMGAVERQRKFFYQVSLPHYLETVFLTKAFDRYGKFLHLHKTNVTNSFLVPCYDIDLIWHAHQLNPDLYQRDCAAFLGKPLNHDDSATDRSKDSHLQQGYARTAELWRDVYEEDYPRCGAMFRGEVPSQSKLTGMPPDLGKVVAYNTALESVEFAGNLFCGDEWKCEILVTTYSCGDGGEVVHKGCYQVVKDTKVPLGAKFRMNYLVASTPVKMQLFKVDDHGTRLGLVGEGEVKQQVSAVCLFVGMYYGLFIKSL